MLSIGGHGLLLTRIHPVILLDQAHLLDQDTLDHMHIRVVRPAPRQKLVDDRFADI